MIEIPQKPSHVGWVLNPRGFSQDRFIYPALSCSCLKIKSLNGLQSSKRAMGIEPT